MIPFWKKNKSKKITDLVGVKPSTIKKYIGRNQLSIGLLGNTGAGKTTCFKVIQSITKKIDIDESVFDTGNLIDDDSFVRRSNSTQGIIQRESLKLGQIDWQFLDVGGQEAFQKTAWRHIAKFSFGIIYLIDATVFPSKENKTQQKIFEESYRAFVQGCRITHLGQCPVALLINKQDLDGAMTIDQAKTLYYLDKKSNYVDPPLLSYNYTNVFATSLKTRQGLDEFLLWFISTLEELILKMVNREPF